MSAGCAIGCGNIWKFPWMCGQNGGGSFVLLYILCLLILGFQPFAEGTAWLDFWDFIVSMNLLPLGALVFALFCCSDRFGWGWDKLLAEANAGKGLKVQQWMKPIFKYVVPVIVIMLYIIGLINFQWR